MRKFTLLAFLLAATLAFASDGLPADEDPVVVQARENRVIDKKFIALHAVAMGLTIADIERTQSCLGNGTCRELNPLIPRSRAGMYAVNVPLNVGLMYLSYRLKASGKRTWWIAPVAVSGAHGVGVGFMF